jgi:hypothetical protein
MRVAPMCYPTCMRASLLLFINALMLVACGDIKPAAPKVCTKAYEQCTMPSGVLGVCDTTDCAAGQSAPCLVCRSQH